jgi:hypothetical protein
MSGLAIFSGIGQGLGEGIRASSINDSIDQENKLRAGKLREMADELEMRSKVKNAMAGVQSDADSRVANSSGNTGIRAAKAAAADSQSQDASASDNFGNALTTDTQVSPSSTSINALSPPPAPSMKQIAAAPDSAGNGAAGLAMPAPDTPPGVNLANSPGIRNIAAAAPSAADSGAPTMSARDAYNATWKEQAPHVAAIYQQYGHPEIAASILKSGDSAEMDTYERKWKTAMRAVDSGNDQQSAVAIQSLYNTDFPDGHGVDIRVVGPGKFQVVQYDAQTGKETAGMVIGKDQLVEYGQTLLNPAERVKLWVADKTAQRVENAANIKERGVEYRSDSQAATAAARDAANADRDNKRWAAMAGMLQTSIAAGKFQHPPRADPEDKAENADVNSALKMVNDKDIPEEAKPFLRSMVSDNVTVNKMKPGPAFDAAMDKYNKANAKAESATNSHLKTVNDANPWYGSDKSADVMDKDVAASSIGKDGKVDAEAYAKQYKDKQLRNSLNAAPVATGWGKSEKVSP